MNRLSMTLTIPPSVNHCYKNLHIKGLRGRILTEEARNWKLMTQYVAKAAVRHCAWELPPADKKIVLEIVAFWPDARRRDMNNTHKLLCDALEGIVYLDDKMVLARDMDLSVDRKHPRLELCIYVKNI